MEIKATAEINAKLCAELKDDETRRDFLAGEAMTWASFNGCLMLREPDEMISRPCPLSLLPTPIPRAAYEKVMNLQPVWQELYYKVSRDVQFLRSVMSASAEADDYVRRLLEVEENARNTRNSEQQVDVVMSIARSDYMVNASDGCAKQIEYNTIAASFAGLSKGITNMHRYMAAREVPEIPLSALPVNGGADGIVDALATASRLHPVADNVVMMLVQHKEKNCFDQRVLEYGLWEQKVPLRRYTMADLAARGSLNEQGNLVMDGKVIGVAYFRAAYSPDDFTSDTEWDGLAMIESSNAIKCPSVAYLLAGFKRVQQELSSLSVLRRYLTDEQCAQIQECCVEIYNLETDSKETKAIIQEAIDHPENFVLKPQREGGGNNKWGEEIPELLQTASITERGAYILMRVIRPGTNPGVHCRDGKAMHVDRTLSELGVYGVYIRQGDEVLMNRSVGHLLRTKTEGTDEGGVATGYSVLDSPLLVD